MNEIDVPVWYSNGNRMLRRDALSTDHPESTYRYIKDQLGMRPEDYDVYQDECPTCGRSSGPEH